MLNRMAVVATMIVLFGGADTALAQSTQAKIVLITDKEASLPTAAGGTTVGTFRAGITRGPKVILVTPTSTDIAVTSPLHLQLKFESFGGSKIDPSTVKVTYLKDPAVDLTDRLKPETQASGIDLPAAEVPAGSHEIRVDVKDADGRSGTTIFTLKVAP